MGQAKREASKSPTLLSVATSSRMLLGEGMVPSVEGASWICSKFLKSGRAVMKTDDNEHDYGEDNC